MKKFNSLVFIASALILLSVESNAKVNQTHLRKGIIAGLSIGSATIIQLTHKQWFKNIPFLCKMQVEKNALNVPSADKSIIKESVKKCQTELNKVKKEMVSDAK